MVSALILPMILANRAVVIFYITSYGHKQVCWLRKNRLNHFPCLSKRNKCRFPIFLIQSVRTIKPYVCRLKQIKLHIRSDIPFITKYCNCDIAI